MTNVSFYLHMASRFVRRALSHREIRRFVGVGLIAVLTFVILTHSFANMGGNLTLAFNTPSPTVDASTKYTVQLPINYTYESRGFTWYHGGADLVAPTGTPVYPIMVGTVTTVNNDYFGYGNHIIVGHEDGYESLYGHLSKTEVSVGQKVELTTEIGKSGSTGFSTGPHLHLEIHQNGEYINPADIVPGVK